MTGVPHFKSSIDDIPAPELDSDGGTTAFVTAILTNISATYGIAFSGYEILRLLGARELEGLSRKVSKDEDGSLRLAELLERVADSNPDQAPYANDYAQIIRTAIYQSHIERQELENHSINDSLYNAATVDAFLKTFSQTGLDVVNERPADDQAQVEIPVAPPIATLATKFCGQIALSTRDAALALNLEEQTLRLWASRQSGPIQPKKIGGRLRWLTTDLQGLLL